MIVARHEVRAQSGHLENATSSRNVQSAEALGAWAQGLETLGQILQPLRGSGQ